MLKKDKSLFDSFNVVEVYGDGIKSVVKNYQKIKKTGREKVKEVFDYTISSQKDADLIARRLLKIFSEDNFAIQINVGSDIPFMQPGQIVSVYFPSEGIFRSEYIVIEIEREFGQPTKLKLGEYNRELSNTMSLLLSETRNLQGRTKLGSYNSVRIPNINLQSLRVKFVKAEVTNLTDDTTSTIDSDIQLALTRGKPMITKDGRGLLKDHIISTFTFYKIGTGGDSTNPNATDLDSPISSRVSVTPTGSSESAVEWNFTVQGSAFIGNTIKEVGIFDSSDNMLVR